jgi:hypothetical protein
VCVLGAHTLKCARSDCSEWGEWCRGVWRGRSSVDCARGCTCAVWNKTLTHALYGMLPATGCNRHSPPPLQAPTQMTLQPDSCQSRIAVWLTSCNVHVPMHTLETRIQNHAFMLLCDAARAGKEETKYTREGPGKPGGQSWTVDWLKFNNSYFMVGWSQVTLTNWELMSGRLADGVSCQWATVMVFVGCKQLCTAGGNVGVCCSC